MRYLIRSNVILQPIPIIKNFRRALSFLLLVVALLLIRPTMVQSKLILSEGDNNASISRSLESLRDLDYQTWQVVVYSQPLEEAQWVLRIVGYPGTLRMDHPTPLQVHAGLREWLLEDITLSNPKLVNDPREAAAEFELTPLLTDLKNNRPLRFMLPKVFNDLPIPPYVVAEWRLLFGSDFG